MFTFVVFVTTLAEIVERVIPAMSTNETQQDLIAINSQK